MNSSLFEACKGYLKAQGESPLGKPRPTLPAITISREAGSGAEPIARLVVEHLEKREKHREYPWAIFDRNLVERILEDHELPRTIHKFMSEDEPTGVTGAIEEILGLHPSSWTMFEHTTDTILRLARAGNCVIVGRGANVITKAMRNVLHVRLVGPLQKRISRCEQAYSLTADEAAAFVAHADRARQRYVHRHFKINIDDPHEYDLVINTGRIKFDAAAQMIVTAIESLLAVG